MVISKLLDRLAMLAGKEDDGYFWVGVALGGVVCPLVEAALVGHSLRAAAAKHATARGW